MAKMYKYARYSNRILLVSCYWRIWIKNKESYFSMSNITWSPTFYLFRSMFAIHVGMIHVNQAWLNGTNRVPKPLAFSWYAVVYQFCLQYLVWFFLFGYTIRMDEADTCFEITSCNYYTTRLWVILYQHVYVYFPINNYRSSKIIGSMDSN